MLLCKHIILKLLLNIQLTEHSTLSLRQHIPNFSSYNSDIFSDLTYYYIRLTAFFQDNLGKLASER